MSAQPALVAHPPPPRPGGPLLTARTLRLVQARLDALELEFPDAREAEPSPLVDALRAYLDSLP